MIDVSGDGYNNRGRPVERARDAAVAAGITINGLPIVNDRPNPWGGSPPRDLNLYFEQRVVGGPGAFIVIAEDYTAFASAILSKLLLEMNCATRLPSSCRRPNRPPIYDASLRLKPSYRRATIPAADRTPACQASDGYSNPGRLPRS